MTIQHKGLTVERWSKMRLCEQMANIGSEVHRAFNWRNKGNERLSQNAFIRALELIDLSLAAHTEYPKLKEFARMRELLVDYFYGFHEYHTTEESWRKYFDQFNYMARKHL